MEVGEFPLSEFLIQHVQSFLTGKEAAQTSLVSKSWYSAWSTRPDLEFDQRHFENRGDEQGLWECANKTIQRYQDLNLKIDSFRLWLRYLLRSDCTKELIVKVMKMGAVDFTFEISNCSQAFALPSEVLDSKNLIRLSVDGCKIDVWPHGKVSCRELKSLILNRMRVEGDVIRDLISNCPLIEKLTLNWITNLYSKRARTNGFGSSNLHKLKSLFLDYVDVDALFFSNLEANFPCLKDLSLNNCSGYKDKEIQLSSPSLECITFKQATALVANFDVPSIRKFKFVGSIWPSLFFKTASRKWESDISISRLFYTTTWFLKLKKLLTCLSMSKISVSFGIWKNVEKSVDFRGLHETAVENLTIYAPASVWFTVLNCLLWSCRPKFITLHWERELVAREKVDDAFLEILSKRNAQGIREHCLMMHNELEEVDIQLFEGSLTQRLPLPHQIHFHLRWRGGRA